MTRLSDTTATAGATSRLVPKYKFRSNSDLCLTGDLMQMLWRA